MKQKIELPSGLCYVNGLNYEKFAEFLDKENIKYDLHWEANKDYFRSSFFSVNSFQDMPLMKKISMPLEKRELITRNLEENIILGLGFPQHIRKNTLTYFSNYRIMNNFDFSKFHGKVSFSEGKLVERVRISIE